MFPTTNFGDCIRYWTFRSQRHSVQNRRQEVFTKGLDIENLIKTSMIYSVSYFDLGEIGTLFGGLSPPNPPVATGLIQRQMWYQYYAVCSSMYASQLWCHFRKAYIHSLRVSCNFGCRTLYNLQWRGSGSSHQVQCNIPTFEAVLRKNVYLFLEKSCALWCSQIVYTDIRPYSLNTTTAFYFVTECPEVSVSLRTCQSRRHGWVFGGLSPPNWSMKHYKSVGFLSIFRMSSPPAQTQSPLLKIFWPRLWDVCRPQRIRTSPGLIQGWTLFRNMRFSCPTLDVVLLRISEKLC